MRPETKHPKELKELKETTPTKRRKEVIMQTFPCFMQSVPTFERKGRNALKRESFKAPPNAGQWPPLQASGKCADGHCNACRAIPPTTEGNG